MSTSSIANSAGTSDAPRNPFIALNPLVNSTPGKHAITSNVSQSPFCTPIGGPLCAPIDSLDIRYRGANLPYRTFDKIRHVKQAAIVDNKRLGPLLAMIRQSQQLQKPEKRSGPRRRDQAGHMFDVRGAFHVDQPSSRRGRRTGSALCKGSAPARRPIASTVR
jgi:hypothetical protein